MNSLVDQKCEACRIDAPRVSDAEAQDLLQQLPEWRIENRDGIPVLVRQFGFKNFAKAMAFTQRVGNLAEAANHHPALLTEWGSATVSWWTHKIKGLHKNDFVMAAKTDREFTASDQ